MLYQSCCSTNQIISLFFSEYTKTLLIQNIEQIYENFIKTRQFDIYVLTLQKIFLAVIFFNRNCVDRNLIDCVLKILE